MGIDEAGRGPVLGPMVYGACVCPVSKKEELGEMGFADSKTLSEAARDRLFDVIQKSDFIAYMTTALPPDYLSNMMLKKNKYSLNAISHDAAIAMIRKCLDQGIYLQEVYLDTVGDAKKYQSKLMALFPEIDNIIVTPKADSLFPVVSAASICAKVTRDKLLRNWEFPEKDVVLSRDFGSGYPSDPTTKAWLVNNFDNIFGYPTIIRFSWSTSKRVMGEEMDTEKKNYSEADIKAVRVTWDTGHQIRNYFRSVNAAPARYHFFEESKITHVKDL